MGYEEKYTHEQNAKIDGVFMLLEVKKITDTIYPHTELGENLPGACYEIKKSHW